MDSRHAASQYINIGCSVGLEGSFHSLHLLKYFIASLWPATTLSTLKSQLNTHTQKKPIVFRTTATMTAYCISDNGLN
jgi:hypothetical protein